VAEYLAKRGITQESIDAFGSATRPTSATASSVSEEEGLTARTRPSPPGLVTRNDRGLWDRFRDRLIVPIRDRRGRAIAFGGRALRDDQQGKYVNSNQTLLFNKSATLYGLDKASASIRKEGTAVIVEGYFDTIAGHQAGFPQRRRVHGDGPDRGPVPGAERHEDRARDRRLRRGSRRVSAPPSPRARSF
jgi:DNA primase